MDDWRLPSATNYKQITNKLKSNVKNEGRSGEAYKDAPTYKIINH